jgi:hypothetical protein
MSARRSKEQDWRPRFLAAFQEHLTITAACKAAGIGRQTAYDERRRNEDFAQAWEDLDFEVTERLEREAFRRAVEGVVERGTHDENGNLVGEFVIKYSDRALEMLLRARAPQKYRENVFVESTGTMLHDHQVTLLDGRQPVEVEPTSRRAAARALLEAGSENGHGP